MDRLAAAARRAGFRPWARRAARGLAAAAALMAGCAPGPGEDALRPALDHYLAGDCAAAEPGIRAHLLARPQSAVGHYLLARCLHARDTAYLGVAVGEYRTALQLLRRGAGAAPFADAFPGRALEEGIHAGLAALHLDWAALGLAHGLPPEFTRDHLKQAKFHLAEVARIPGFDPNRLDALEARAGQLRARLRALLGAPDLTARVPRPDSPALPASARRDILAAG